MSGIDWDYAYLSLIAALTVGGAVGSASHWAIGVVLFIGWCAIHALLEGIHIVPGVAEELQLETDLMR
jgi:hypothetical protein